MGFLDSVGRFSRKALDVVEYMYDETEKRQKDAIQKWANEASEEKLKKAIKSGRFDNEEREMLGRVYKRRFR